MANYKKEETSADAFDKIFAEVDPETLLAAGLGGIAAAGGVVPPFTRLLMAFSDNSGGLVEDYKTLLLAGTGIGPVWAVLLHYLKNEDPNSKPPNNIAVAASGALEAIIMMTFLKNPELVKLAIELAKDAASGLGGVLKVAL